MYNTNSNNNLTDNQQGQQGGIGIGNIAGILQNSKWICYLIMIKTLLNI